MYKILQIRRSDAAGRKEATQKTNHICKPLDCFATLYAMVMLCMFMHSHHGDLCV